MPTLKRSKLESVGLNLAIGFNSAMEFNSAVGFNLTIGFNTPISDGSAILVIPVFPPMMQMVTHAYYVIFISIP